MTALAWVDASCGASGDMLLGALVELGALDVTQLADALEVDVRIDVTPVTRAGLAATHISVHPAVDEFHQPARTWRDIRTWLEGAVLPEPARRSALATFARLAVAEAAVHATTPEQVHFHEVGAVDSLVDVVGACWGLAALEVATVWATPVALGGGSVRAAHGVLPVPGPAVLRLLADGAVPAHGGPVDVELCTPTGAALLAEHVSGWGLMPSMVVTATGTGAGTRELPDRPNVLRIVLGHAAGPAVSAQVVLETNVDDLDPRIWPHVLAAVLAAGAADAWLTPILMKKGRPAHTLSALVDPHAVSAVSDVIFAETTALGLREHRVAKHALAREVVTVDLDGVGVRVKLGLRDGEVTNVQPEWDDVAAAAAALGRPLKQVLAEARSAAEQRRGRRASEGS